MSFQHTKLNHITLESPQLNSRLTHTPSQTYEIDSAVWTEDYVWLVVFAAFGTFFAAFGIGANDVANAFATSVGAKSLTIKQAIVIAAIFEFSGALLLGSDVMNTVRKDIADATCFQDNPPLLMHGMMCALYVAFLSLYLQIHVLFIYDYANSKIIITGTLLDSGFCLRVISRCPSVQLTRLLVLLLV